MKFTGKTLAILLVLVIFASLIPGASAAQTAYQVESGKTASLKMEFENIEGLQINGITVENGGMIVSKSYDDSALGMQKMSSNGDMALWMNMGSAVKKATLILKVKVTGNVGDRCALTVSYTTTSNMGMEQKTDSITFTVTIKETPKPVTPPTIEYGELNNQITVAEGLEKGKYTIDSWAVLETALTTARNARSSKNQSTVDQAATGLKNAIAALVKMDYATLMAAIDSAKFLQTNDEAGALWTELANALTEAMDLLNSGDQAKVDASAQRLLNAVSALQRYLSTQTHQPTDPTEPSTKPTEPGENEQQCSVPSHKIWPMLFWISLAVNVAFAVLIVLYVTTKRKMRKDTTPLVEYNIEDDDE